MHWFKYKPQILHPHPLNTLWTQCLFALLLLVFCSASTYTEMPFFHMLWSFRSYFTASFQSLSCRPRDQLVTSQQPVERKMKWWVVAGGCWLLLGEIGSKEGAATKKLVVITLIARKLPPSPVVSIGCCLPSSTEACAMQTGNGDR